MFTPKVRFVKRFSRWILSFPDFKLFIKLLYIIPYLLIWLFLKNLLNRPALNFLGKIRNFLGVFCNVFLRNKIRKIIFWRIIWVEYLSKIIFIIILVDKNKRIQNWQKPFRQFVDDSEPPHFWNLIRKIESLLNIDFKKLGYKLRNFLTWAKKWQFGRKPPLKPSDYKLEKMCGIFA